MNWSKEWKTPTDIKNVLVELGYLEHKVFEFRDGHKSRAIDVIIVGDLGLDFDDDGWNIYHIPTLSCFSKAVPASHNKHELFCNISRYGLKVPLNEVPNCNCKPEPNYEYDPDQLLSWMKKVQENNPTAWTMLRLLTPENFKDKGESAKQIILDWCLSVRVE